MTPTSRISTACLAALLAGTPTGVAAWDGTQQQLGRFRVLIPDLEALDDADRDFGEDVARELRALLSGMATHRAVERGDIEDELDALDLDMEDLDCLLTRQLASRMEAEVALCASYSERERDVFDVEAVFWDIAADESFGVSPTTGTDRDEETVARHIFGQFDRYTQHLRAVSNCESYAVSQQWEAALRLCDEALALNADAIGARYRRARILFEMERGSEALAELERVLARSPAHEAALELAGYVSATLGLREEGVGYYARYLQLSPGNAGVRMRVAYELAQAGDPAGAQELIREGLAADPENTDLWEQYGGYAFTIGESINREAAEIGDGGALAPDAIPYFRDAIDAYRRVYATRGAETPARHLVSIVVAHVRLGEYPLAVSIGSEAIEIHPQEAGLWSIYGDALRRSGRLDAALDALQRVSELDPGYPNLGLRRGSWLLEAGRIMEAVEALRSVAATEPARADEAARLVLADAHANGVRQDEYEYATRWIVVAKSFANVTEPTLHQLNFWHAYSVLQTAVAEQEPRTLETARSTLPKFQEVLALLDDVGEYPATVSVSLQNMRSNVDVYIEIQEAIIRRG